MAQRQVKIREEAYERASSLAQRLGRTTSDVVEDALLQYEPKIDAGRMGDMTEEQQRRFDRIMALANEASRHKLPGATSDHSDMYDDYGLPK